MGMQKGKIREIVESKKDNTANNVININDLIVYLTKSLTILYKQNDLTMPSSQSEIKCFFKFFIEYTESVLLQQISLEDKEIIYFVNSHTDMVFGKFDNKLSELSSNIERLLQISVVYKSDSYEKIKNEYYKILKTKNSEAHIYLLDKFDFSKFYVPPILQTNSKDMPYIKKYIFEIETHEFDFWKHIFDQRNIIYITGGAGYGKSLFLKKIINDYSNLNLFRSQEYLVIYGELKMFYPNNSDTPISVIDFLRNSMKISTLLDEEKITYGFVEYYLNIGRCIILLDALDEVEKTKRASLHESVVSFFKNQNPNNKICITSRNRGFIPENDIEVFNISPLNITQIERYVNNIIALKKFEENDKASFMKQTSILVKKGFLNSFLVLSLLINIYKAERELPENKLELYQKCFEYIANKRERDKMQNRYNWEIISPMMKDNTFMELAEMCFPNNTDVDKTVIKDKLLKIYKSKYGNEVQTENAIEEFLKFCSDRTELFVPAAEEDKFKFFHRSFFEYFYSQYIFFRCNNAKEILDKLLQFDIDSEVFELTVAMLKQKAEDKYQKLIELMFEKTKEEFRHQNSNFLVFNVLLLSMQVVDDILYQTQLLDLLLNNKEIILHYKEKMHNMNIISDVFISNKISSKKITEKYYLEALEKIVLFATELIIIWDNIKPKLEIEKNNVTDGNLNTDGDLKEKTYIPQVFLRMENKNDFYVDIFLKTENIYEIFINLKSVVENEVIENNLPNREKQRILTSTEDFCNQFNSLDAFEKKIFVSTLKNNMR